MGCNTSEPVYDPYKTGGNANRPTYPPQNVPQNNSRSNNSQFAGSQANVGGNNYRTPAVEQPPPPPTQPAVQPKPPVSLYFDMCFKHYNKKLLFLFNSISKHCNQLKVLVLMMS